MLDRIAPLGTSFAPTGPTVPVGNVGQPAQVAPVAGTGNTDFASLLGSLFTDTTNTLRTAEATSIASIKGQATTQQVVEAVMSAEQTLQAAIANRDKVTAAYLELSRMQI